ncbi:uncharacterized protein LOC135151093 [Daucus carota subsp. sativus]|uniref:uncharacterized protein LOC135151093 n=1 Tax=Daucus carota subsp. sativus TaxID=79200 RepID=UPI003083D57D
MFLDTFIGKRAFSDRNLPRFIPWNNYCLIKLEQVLIQRSFLVNGELRTPDIDYMTLQGCRVKGKIGDAEVQTDTQATPVEEMHLERGNWCSLKRDDGDLDWDLKLKSTTKGQEWPCRTAYRASSSRTSYHQEKQEWSDNNRDVKVQGTEPSSIFEQVKTSEWIGCTTIDEDKFVNVKHRLIESLLTSYQSVQQTFLLHMLYAKDNEVPDEKMKSIKKAFKDMNEKDMNEKANLVLD